MNFERLENKHYIMIVIGLVALYLLHICDKNENFSVIPEFPHLPPKYWGPRRRTKWSPWWYYENEYHPAVPMVTQYDSADYRLPVGAESLVNGVNTPIVDEVNDIDDESKVVPEIKEAFIVKKKLNFSNLVVVVLLALVIYYVLKNQDLI